MRQYSVNFRLLLALLEIVYCEGFWKIIFSYNNYDVWEFKV